MNNETRVRFAPSPTGHLHIGGLRVAIFNWLFAKHSKGKFLIRIEDTDLERSKNEYTDSILESFKWMSMQPDESIVIQSERVEEHKKLLNDLIDQGKAYRCFCPPRKIEELESPDTYSKYDGNCRNKIIAPQDLKNSFVVRFKLPNESIIAVNDNNHLMI
jgi:glutamyl-tRNA synthetase